MNAVIAVNNQCNLRCKMCDIGQHVEGSGMHNNWLTQRELSPKEWLELLGGLKVDHVHVQGVEPLLYEYIDELLALLSRTMSVWLTTNGWFLSRHVATVGSCCDNLAVSLDGATANVHDAIRGVPGSFDRAVTGIKAVRATWPKVKVRTSFAITPDNYRDITKFSGILCRELGVVAVFNHYNYIHPRSCVGYSCMPANMAVYDPASIDVEELHRQISACGSNCSFMPQLTSVDMLRRYYCEPPTETIPGRSCGLLKRAVAGTRRSIAADGSFMIAGRCWVDAACKGTWEDRLKQALLMLEGGLPAPCQRLCCAGLTVQGR